MTQQTNDHVQATVERILQDPAIASAYSFVCGGITVIDQYDSPRHPVDRRQTMMSAMTVLNDHGIIDPVLINATVFCWLRGTCTLNDEVRRSIGVEACHLADQAMRFDTFTNDETPTDAKIVRAAVELGTMKVYDAETDPRQCWHLIRTVRELMGLMDDVPVEMVAEMESIISKWEGSRLSHYKTLRFTCDPNRPYATPTHYYVYASAIGDAEQQLMIMTSHADHDKFFGAHPIRIITLSDDGQLLIEGQNVDDVTYQFR